MDENLYNLNLEYLIVAQTLILSASEQKAMFCLGLTPEAVSLLRTMPLTQLKIVARSEHLTFIPRFNPHKWGEFLQIEKRESETSDKRARDLLMFLPSYGGNS
ncbi:MAG: transcriptional regulator [Proteobacteria bacterium ST_bin11]|nr:MAG: transcriptional regulator [Proteobacteria bacterium ST_bin11]